MEESGDDGAGAQEVGDGADALGRRGRNFLDGTRRLAVSKFQIRPRGGNQGLAAVGKNEEKLEDAIAMKPIQNVEDLALEWVALSDDGDPGREVPEVGSVSCISSIGSTTTC